MVASAAAPTVTNNPQTTQPQTQVPPNIPPTRAPNQPRQANVLMGVIPSTGSGVAPNLDQLLNSVLSSVGISVNNQRDNNNQGSNQEGAQQAPSVPFQSLNNLVQSLENQVNTATNEQVQQSPPNNEYNTSVERLGNLMTRIANSMNRLQPILNQLGNQLTNESSLTGENRQSAQQTVTRVVPAVQQLGSALAIVASSMRSIRLGENPGQSTVNDTSDDSHRTFIGPRGNVTVHIGNSNNSNEGGSPNVNNLMQGIFSSLSGQGNNTNASPQSTNQQSSSVPQNNNNVGNRSQPQTSQPNPTPNLNNNQNSSTNNQNAGGNFDFMNMINQLAASMDQDSPPTVASANATASTPIGNVMQNLLSNLSGTIAQTVNAQSSTSNTNSNSNNSNNNNSSSNNNLDASANMLDMLTQSLGVRDQSIGSFLGYSQDGTTEPMSFLLNNISFSDFSAIYRGNRESVERLHPLLVPKLREWIGTRQTSDYVNESLESIFSTMNEDLLPEEIKNKRKPGTNVTQISQNVLRDRMIILVDGILNNQFNPTPTNPSPFYDFIFRWTTDTVGITTDALAEGMVGGVTDAQSVINFFLCNRFYLLHSSFGPMAASLMTPLISRAYQRYRQRIENNTANNSNSTAAMDVDNEDTEMEENDDNNNVDDTLLKNDFSNLESIIEDDVRRQENQPPQRPFSDSYTQSIPVIQRRQVFAANELRDPDAILEDHFTDALENSGVVNSNETASYQRIVQNNDTLSSLYMEEIRKSIQDRINNDPDFEESRFPNATKVFKKQDK